MHEKLRNLLIHKAYATDEEIRDPGRIVFLLVVLAILVGCLFICNHKPDAQTEKAPRSLICH